ncbi:MAG: molybdenum cofactor biosynthesis protein MoaB [Candidatus Thermoplasmatota archaeon]|nr:molybdenum cofactor biosynthesis protein MoaB [Candidatus Thermoplasmatota archaeon]
MPHSHNSAGIIPDFGVLTCSSTRSKEEDDSGKIIVSLLKESGFDIKDYEVIKDDFDGISGKIMEMSSSCDIIIVNGGTGITKYDVTIEAARSVSDKELTGFAIQFQVLSMHEMQSASMLSRASGFIVNRKAVFCLPGSKDAVSLGMKKLIIPEIAHIMHELRR